MAYELVQRRCPPGARDWLDRTFSRLESPLDRNLFGAAYAGARRRLGSSPVTLDAEEESALQGTGILALNGRTLDEVCRIALLLLGTESLPADQQALFINEVYLRGDNYERQALLRALTFLPDPERFMATAVEACRTNAQVIFEAIACDNPYPFRYFPGLNFNQMVLKALFIGSPLARVIGLEERITSELIRMAEGYASERRAAGRPVPEDITFITIDREARHEAI